jgi:hypothetical protein
MKKTIKSVKDIKIGKLYKIVDNADGEWEVYTPMTFKSVFDELKKEKIKFIEFKRVSDTTGYWAKNWVIDHDTFNKMFTKCSGYTLTIINENELFVDVL